MNTSDSGPLPGTPVNPDPAAGRDLAPWLRRAAIAVAVLAVIALLGAYVLPRKPEVTRSAEIAAPAAAVFPLVGDLRRLPEWAPPFTTDPDIVITYTGPLDGVGQTMAWESRLPQVGSGRAVITLSEPDGVVEMAVERDGQGETTVWFNLEARGDKTLVLWGVRTDLGFSPIARYAGLGVDGAVGPDLERGLARLKGRAETPPAAN